MEYDELGEEFVGRWDGHYESTSILNDPLISKFSEDPMITLFIIGMTIVQVLKEISSLIQKGPDSS